MLLENPAAHATDLLTERPTLNPLLADWLASALTPRSELTAESAGRYPSYWHWAGSHLRR
jgi:hypothetical protein